MGGVEGSNADIDFAALGIEHVDIIGHDEPGYKMLATHLETSRAFIERSRAAGGRCLVHCIGGVNRSGVLVAAEVMLGEQLPVLEAVMHCRRARGPIYLTNEGFQLELISLAKKSGLLGPCPASRPPVPPPRA